MPYNTSPYEVWQRKKYLEVNINITIICKGDLIYDIEFLIEFPFEIYIGI